MRGPIAQVQQAVAEEFGLTVAEITGNSRKKPVVQARHMAIGLARELLAVSYNVLGREFGNRDHATTLSSVRRDKELIEQNSDYAASRRRVLDQLHQ
jgi:chromosomal replication initiator protein